MKVIDIMQKVANKEIFKFRIDDVNYYVDKSNYICEEDGTKVEWYIDDEWLNMNAEIIEEDKKIEKLEIVHNGSANAYALLNEYGTKCALTKHSKVMCDKINEIIDKLNEMEKE